MAREGQREVPVTPAPTPLRRYLNFARLPDPALEVARRVLDDDDEFRTRVAAAADEEAVGRGGWLFLHRPDGWQEELDGLLQKAAAAEIAAKDERHERGAQRRLVGAEAALARAEATAQRNAAGAVAARSELVVQRRAAEALGETVKQLQAEVDRLGRERTDIIRRLKSTEAAGVQRSAELRAARHEVRMLQAELTQALPDMASTDGGAPEPPGSRASIERGLDRAQVAKVVEDAVAASAYLSEALQVLAGLAGLPGVGATPGDDPVGGPAEVPERPVARRRRAPLPLPPAVLDDSREAAEHLVRVPGVLVLVDGYNISHAQWHDLAPVEQRARLRDACSELHARVGVRVEVIFDGAGEQASVGSLARSDVRFQFTPEGVEADDVVLDRLDEEPAVQPVVVVSSDRRVRDGAARRGANLLGARQFLAVLRR